MDSVIEEVVASFPRRQFRVFISAEPYENEYSSSMWRVNFKQFNRQFSVLVIENKPGLYLLFMDKVRERTK